VRPQSNAYLQGARPSKPGPCPPFAYRPYPVCGCHGRCRAYQPYHGRV